MPFAPDYATLAQLKAYLRITDTTDDAELGFALTAASRAIDLEANRQFGLTGSAVARYYTAQTPELRDSEFQGRYVLEIDDLMTTTGLVVKVDRDDDGVFEETLAVDTDFRLYPYNAPANSRPWTHVVLESGETLPPHPRGVEIAANWGWSTVPTVVLQAALIQAARFFVRRLAPFGIAGSPETGSEMRLLARLDPDVALAVRSVARPWVAA